MTIPPRQGWFCGFMSLIYSVARFFGFACLRHASLRMTLQLMIDYLLLIIGEWMDQFVGGCLQRIIPTRCEAGICN